MLIKYPDNRLVVESKYLQHTPSAENLSKFLLEFHANQKLIIYLDLPMKYCVLQCGDIIKFKRFGNSEGGEDFKARNINEEYSIKSWDAFGVKLMEPTSVNGQTMLPYYMVTECSLDVEGGIVSLALLQMVEIDTI